MEWGFRVRNRVLLARQRQRRRGLLITGGVLPEEANDALQPLVVHQAQVYALEAELQANRSALNPQTTFQPG